MAMEHLNMLSKFCLEEMSHLMKVPCFVEILLKSISTVKFSKLHEKYEMVALVHTCIKMKL